jgi:hypothetical protein
LAEELKIACDMWLAPESTNEAYYDVPDQTNDYFNPAGITVADGAVGRIQFRTATPVPADVNATPAGKLWVYWTTASSDTTSFMHLVWLVRDIADATESLDPASGDFEDSSSSQSTSGGAGLLNKTVITLSGSDLTSGKMLIGRLVRDASAGNSSDTLAAATTFIAIVLVMDQA